MSYTPAATALATASPQTVHAVADTIDLDLVTEFVDGRTTYTARVMEVEVLRFDGDRRRFEMTLEITRTTSRSVKVFRAITAVDNYTDMAGNVDQLRVTAVYNENVNQVYSDRFDGYRQAAVEHSAGQVETALANLQAAVEVLDQPETAQAAPAPAVEDTAITARLDPATGGRVLDDKDRQALRQGPPQDDSQHALSAALDQAGPVEAASIRRTVFYLAAAYHDDPEYTRAEVLADLSRRAGWSTLEAAQVLDSELGETRTQSGEGVHAPTHTEDTHRTTMTHEYVTADQLVTLHLDLAVPLQPSLPTLPDPRHGLAIHIRRLEVTPDPSAWSTGGAWWDWGTATPHVVTSSLGVRDGDNHASVELRAMEAVSRLYPAVEWLDMDKLEHQWHTCPEMDDRLAAAWAAIYDALLGPDRHRRWVGVCGLRLEVMDQ